MFGYIRPLKDEMKMKDYEIYKSVYCGLCRHLGRDYGLLARLTLSYDCTVLAMLAMSLKNDGCTITRRCCCCNPLKKCLMCDTDEKGSFEFAGAVSVMMAYYKLTDTMIDGSFLKKCAAAVLKLLLYRNYRKAARQYPEIDRLTAEMMSRQQQAEKQNANTDQSAAPSAELIAALCRMLTEDEGQQFVLGEFGYYVGRWIYLMDAADDLEKDVKENNFNPYKNVFKENSQGAAEFCNASLNMTAARIIQAYDLLELHLYKDILDNIVYEGLAFQQRYCLFEKKSNAKSKSFRLSDSRE